MELIVRKGRKKASVHGTDTMNNRWVSKTKTNLTRDIETWIMSFYASFNAIYYWWSRFSIDRCVLVIVECIIQLRKWKQIVVLMAVGFDDSLIAVDSPETSEGSLLKNLFSVYLFIGNNLLVWNRWRSRCVNWF